MEETLSVALSYGDDDDGAQKELDLMRFEFEADEEEEDEEDDEDAEDDLEQEVKLMFLDESAGVVVEVGGDVVVVVEGAEGERCQVGGGERRW